MLKKSPKYYFLSIAALLLLVSCTLITSVFAANSLTTRLKGRLLLQVEDRGRIWYVDPVSLQKYEITFANALDLFQNLSLGITNSDLNHIPINPEAVSDQLDTDHDGYTDKTEVKNGYHPEIASNPANRGNDKVLPYPALMNRLKGRLLLQVEDRGRIWYVDMDGTRWEVTWGNLMNLFRKLALGISNKDLAEVGNEDIADWQTYTNSEYGFEFKYPTNYSIKSSENYLVYLVDASNNASISLNVTGQFNLESIKDNYAPTGSTTLPEAVTSGQNTFYYYGPGGGGVSYPDQYFYDLSGQLLTISFDGPYANDKTPTAQTKQIESQMLSTFKFIETMTIKLFFHNKTLANDPNLNDCGKVFPIERTIPKTEGVAKAALTELFLGPTPAEIELGYSGSFAEGTKVNSITIVDEVALVNFNEKIEYGFTSCSGTFRLSAVEQTLLQFPTIKEIKYSVNGNDNRDQILQP